MQWLLTLRGALPQLTLSNQRSFLQALPMELLAWQSIAKITATFSEAMQSSTINTNTFTVSNGAGNISGTVSYSGTTATFTPSANLGFNTMYTARITTGVRNLAGNAMASDFTWSFTTVDTIQPTVISTSPANGATGVAINSDITATFSEAMQSSTINTNTFTVSGGAATSAGRFLTAVRQPHLPHLQIWVSTQCIRHGLPRG